MAAVVGLLRPLNGVMAGAAVLVGAAASAHHLNWWAAALGAIGAFAASCAANSLNDAADVDSDRINRPERPVAAGRLSSRSAVWIAVVLFVVSGLVVAPLGGAALAMVALWVVLTTLYSLALERMPLVGNVVVALVAASPLLMGGLAQGILRGAAVAPVLRDAPGQMTIIEPVAGPRLVVMFGLAALLHLAREIVKSAEDAGGDAASGKKTIAVKASPSAALAVARVLLVVTMWAAVAPYVLGLLGIGYVGVLVPLEAALAWAVVASSRAADDPARIRLVSNGLKVVMALGLIAFVAGS